jgi:hypothetical protein
MHVNCVYASLGGHALWGEGLGRLIVEVTGSNPASGVDICPMSLYVLLSQALRRACHLFKESAMCVSEEMMERPGPYNDRRKNGK